MSQLKFCHAGQDRPPTLAAGIRARAGRATGVSGRRKKYQGVICNQRPAVPAFIILFEAQEQIDFNDKDKGISCGPVAALLPLNPSSPYESCLS